MAVILVAKINDVFADVRNLLLLAEFCKHDQWEYMPVLGNLWKAILPIRGKHLAPHGQASCPTWASIVPILEHKTVEAQVSCSVLETGKSIEFLPV